MIEKALKKIIEEKGVKCNYIAQRVGMTPQQFSRALNEQRKFSVLEFFRVCEVLEEDPKEVVRQAKAG